MIVLMIAELSFVNPSLVLAWCEVGHINNQRSGRVGFDERGCRKSVLRFKLHDSTFEDLPIKGSVEFICLHALTLEDQRTELQCQLHGSTIYSAAHTKPGMKPKQ